MVTALVLWDAVKAAAGVETAALIAAAGAGYRPVQGWEYLPVEALPVVLDVVDAGTRPGRGA